VSSVRYKLCFYIQGDGIVHSQRREDLKSYIAVELLRCVSLFLTKLIKKVSLHFPLLSFVECLYS
jgi:hypothetical protein